MQERENAARVSRLENITSKRYFPFIFFAVITVVAAIAITPFYVRYRTGEPGFDNRTGMIASHDMANHLAMFEAFYKGLESGVAYPRWFADANHGYGMPQMNYYPTGFYYIAGAAQALTHDWGDAMLIASILVFIASGLAFYYFARLFFSRRVSALSALLFMLFPYHVLDLYWRGALAELLGFVFIPLIMRFAYKIGTEGRLRHYAGMGLCYGLYLMSHMPVGYMFSLALSFYALAWAVMARQIKIAFRLVAGMLLGIALGAPYWLPAVFEANEVQEEASQIWPYMKSFLGTHIENHPFEQALYAQFFVLVATLIAAIVFLRRSSRQSNDEQDGDSRGDRQQAQFKTQVRLWIVLAFGAAFMSTWLSAPISKLIPKIDATSPAWRWVAISNVFGCMIIGLAIDRMSSRLQASRKALVSWRNAFVGLIVINVLGSISMIGFVTAYQEPQWVIHFFLSRSFNPINCVYSESIPDMPLVALSPKEGAAVVERWDPEYRKVRLQLNEAGNARLRTYNFLGWKARVDGQPAEVAQDEYGAIVVPVPAGAHTLEVYFGSTPARTTAYVSCLLAFLAIVGLTGIDRVKKNQRTKGKQASSGGMREDKGGTASTSDEEISVSA